MPDLLETTNYTLLSSHFTKESLKGNENYNKIKSFFDDVSKDIFTSHITIYKDVGELPFIYSEKAGYATITSSLSKLSPYVISEYPFDCKDNNKVENKSTRFVDFWYMDKNTRFEAYIESKQVYQSLQDITNLQNNETIKNGLKQIYDLQNIKAHTFSDCQTIGLMLLSLCFYAPSTLKERPIFKTLQQETLNCLENYIDNRRYMGILCSGVDISSEIEKSQKNELKLDCFRDYGYYEMPYLMLVGFIVEMPK